MFGPYTNNTENKALYASFLPKVEAYREKIKARLTNGAIYPFSDEDLKRTEKLDEYFKRTGMTVGPLHDLPFLLKEHDNHKGRVTYGACVSKIDNITDNWYLAVQVLIDAGVVFYVRTRELQAIMHLYSNNNITGLCRNPSNTELTTGISSPGERTLVAMTSPVFGIGSDIGGSIRCPTQACDIF
ncbi:hypothetical protein KL925_004297 [Ogataea polymorpha]|nr:hypothetical protein KL908_004176 [Ogataea polymorpha]KAG7899093.1 hypothetical protein KL935_004101 [Ogataea polymorpha]KAG7907214.1 hypothetical protein KL906_003901 [Ogataea polymorpha]KAG7925282.1 hypothetical protein KL925_004297 [Ogataea polymorpha]KAG7932502.1 hypothetical protein KL934_003945 [Ogataea polymorpha]